MVVRATGLWCSSGYCQCAVISQDEYELQSGPDTFSLSSCSTFSEQEIEVGRHWRGLYVYLPHLFGSRIDGNGLGSLYISIH